MMLTSIQELSNFSLIVFPFDRSGKLTGIDCRSSEVWDRRMSENLIGKELNKLTTMFRIIDVFPIQVQTIFQPEKSVNMS